MSKNKWEWLRDELEELKRQSQYRSLSSSSPQGEGWIVRDGHRMLNLASNHYLGLEQKLDAELLESLTQSAAAVGGEVRVGSTASRLIVGNDPSFCEFEREFAAFKSTESCLLFSSGYMANLGTISALMGRKDIVFSDRLNHASITDGILLSRAEHVRYRHRDMPHLEQLLQRADPAAKKLIVTDSIFSMDGSMAPLEQLVELKNRYNAMLMVDEAHSGGIYGPHGEGLTYHLGLTDQVEIQLGTFSKAYGSYGAYIAGDQVLKEYLINKARSFMYTTALPPMVVLSIRHNWLQAMEVHQHRDELLANSQWFRESLQGLGFDTGESECHIVPIIVAGSERVLQFSGLLQQLGIAAVAIRPPTVPEGTERIRFTLTAAHRREDIGWALEQIAAAGKELGII